MLQSVVRGVAALQRLVGDVRPSGLVSGERLQRRGEVVDPSDMRTFGAWALVVTGVAVGLLAASWFAQWPTSVALLVLAAGVALAVSVPGRRSRGFGLALVLLGLVRGVTAQVAGTQVLEADRRGQALVVRVVTVVEASTPGPRCRVRAETARGQVVPLAMPPEVCPLAWGDRVALPSTDLHTDTAHARPEPRQVIDVGQAWRVAPVPLRWWQRPRAALSAAVANVRQAGWDAARGEPGRGFVVACSLGLSAALPPEVRRDLRRAGLGHLVAVSGLHVGLAAWLWLAVLRWGLSRWWWGARAAVVGSALPVLAFVVLTGAAPPAVRAGVMYGLVAVGSVLGRPTHAPSVLLVAVACMLFVAPSWLLTPGFQLSVAAMVVLVGLPAPARPAFTSWHLGWALLPLLWWHFDVASDGGVLANAVAVPVFALWVVPWAVLGWSLVPWLGAAALDPAALGADVILDVARLASELPELPRGVWVVGAALVWVPGLRHRLSPLGRRWLPHRGAAALLLLVAGHSILRPEPVVGWTAWGPGSHPEVLVVTPDGAACVAHPRASPRVWSLRFEAAGVAGLEGIRSRRSSQDPGLVGWVAAVRGTTPTPRGVPRCPFPEPLQVRRALARCQVYSPTPSARRGPGGDLQCWSARLGRWRDAPLHSFATPS